MASRLAGASIAIVNKLRIDAALIAGLPDLKMVAVAATGTNNIDLDACARAASSFFQHSRLCRAYGAGAHPGADAGPVLQPLRVAGIGQAGRWQQSEQFCYFDHPIRDLRMAPRWRLSAAARW